MQVGQGKRLKNVFVKQVTIFSTPPMVLSIQYLEGIAEGSGSINPDPIVQAG